MRQRGNNRLLELRKSHKTSRVAIAAHLEIGEHQVRRWEANEVLIPSKHIPTLAAFLGVEPAHLMGWDREKAAA